jgi:dUTP pyrophosphatase
MSNVIRVKKLDKTARGLVFYEHSGDSGMDICINYDLLLEPNVPFKIGTGIAVEIPDGTVGLLWDKSSNAALGLKVIGGVIDAGYRGEIFVILINLTKVPLKIYKDKRIAQLIIQNYTHIEALVEVTELSDGHGQLLSKT